MVWGLLSQPARGARTKGVIDALQGGRADGRLPRDRRRDQQGPGRGRADLRRLRLLAPGREARRHRPRRPHRHRGDLPARPRGKRPGDIKIAGFDLSPATIAAIKGGWTGLVIDQQEWLQGYLPILQICLTKVYGFSGLHINTGRGLRRQEQRGHRRAAGGEEHPLTRCAAEERRGAGARAAAPALADVRSGGEPMDYSSR